VAIDDETIILMIVLSKYQVNGKKMFRIELYQENVLTISQVNLI
jgi:hypothetical protein